MTFTFFDPLLLIMLFQESIPVSLQLLSVIFSVGGSGLSAYFGLRIANVENKKSIQFLESNYNNLRNDHKELQARFERLQERFVKTQ